MKSQRRLATCVTISKQNFLFILGGLDKALEVFINIIEKYDAAFDEWKMIRINKKNLAFVSGAFSVPYTNSIFIFGGLKADG